MLAELPEVLRTSAGLTTIWRALNQLDFTLKKTVCADEQRRPDVATERRHWRDYVRQYVFLDEWASRQTCSAARSQSPRRAVARSHATRPLTVVAALRPDGVTAPAVFDGPIDNVSFLPDVEQVLVPSLQPGDDSFSITWWCIASRTSAPRSKEPAPTSASCPTSPDFNPIELAFAKLKAFLRAARPRTFDQVTSLVTAALGLFTPAECRNCARHCGYRLAVQL